MTALFVLLGVAGVCYALWIHFLAVMALSRAKKEGKLTQTARWFGTPVLWAGLVLDVLVNWLVMTWLLAELPREWTVSERLTRHIVHGADWRQAVCLGIAFELLDAFDPAGTHRVGD
jgi:hypothetical protein